MGAGLPETVWRGGALLEVEPAKGSIGAGEPPPPMGSAEGAPPIGSAAATGVAPARGSTEGGRLAARVEGAVEVPMEARVSLSGEFGESAVRGLAGS